MALSYAIRGVEVVHTKLLFFICFRVDETIISLLTFSRLQSYIDLPDYVARTRGRSSHAFPVPRIRLD